MAISLPVRARTPAPAVVTAGGGVEPGADVGARRAPGARAAVEVTSTAVPGLGREPRGGDLGARSPGADAGRADVAELDAREVVAERRRASMRLGARLGAAGRV